jgi:NADPH-dependent 2,4-dienoyl-CoA reductase/sulfur reductase-like enzyme/rhodanese-related sulfurtransferase
LSKKIVVIGGVAGGAGAATKARRVDEDAEVIIFERSPYVSFANCGLPYHIGGQIEERETLFLNNPQKFLDWYNIKVKVNHEVTKINPEQKTVEVINHSTGEKFSESYDKLIVSTGGSPIKPPIPGIDKKHIHNLWTVQDMDDIKAIIEKEKPHKAAVIGAGFVGLEMVEALAERGIDVTLIELLEQVLPPLDPEMSIPVTEHLKEKGVEVILGDGVQSFLGDEKVEKIQLKSGKTVEADFVIVSIGVKPNVEILKDAGIQLGDQGGVMVNERMETSVPDIYAAGDIVEVNHLVSGKKVRIPLAGPANKQGRVAGANAAGGNLEFKGVLGTSIVKIFDITAAKTGLNEKEASEEGLDFFVSYTVNKDHAGYYPGAEWMHVKTIVENETGRILGAQIVGPKGVDKRIDVMATAIYAGLTCFDLEQLDLAYAPPYSSAKDPVIIAGMVASNVLRGEIEIITPRELEEMLKSGEEIQVIDNRAMVDLDKDGVMEEADVIPIGEFREWYEEDIDKDKPVVVVCGIGYRSYLAYRILKQKGYNVKSLSGGYSTRIMRTPRKK